MTVDVVRTERDYRKALARIDALTPGDGEVVEGSEEARELDVLTVLVHHYEREQQKIEPPDPIEAIKFQMDQAGLTREELEAALGGSPRVSEVMNRRRPLSIAMIRNLVELGIPPASLVGRIERVRPYPTRTPGGAKLVKERARRYRKGRPSKGTRR